MKNLMLTLLENPCFISHFSVNSKQLAHVEKLATGLTLVKVPESCDIVLLKLMYLKILTQETKTVTPAKFWKVWFQNARLVKSA